MQRVFNGDLLERLPDLGELARSPDQRRLQRSDRRSFPGEVLHPPGGTRLGSHRIDRRRPANQPRGLLAEQDLAVGGGVLELAGGRHGVADDRQPAAARSAGQDLPGRDPDADRLPSRRIADLERSRHGPDRIVLVDSRDAEHGRHLVAKTACDRPAVAPHGPRELRAVALLIASQGLRIEAADGRPAHGHHRHRLSHLGRGSGNGARRRGRLLRPRGRRLERDLECRLLAQDRRLQALKQRARHEAELLVEGLARLPIDLERVRLATGAVESEHQLPAQPLAQRVVPDQGLELRHQVGCAAEREIRHEALLDRVQPQLLEARDLGLSEGVVGEVDERRAPPQLERRAEPVRCGRGILRFACPSALTQQALEPVGVELVGPDAKHVPGSSRDQELAGGASSPLGLERLAQLPDVDLESVGRGLRWLRPELVDQPIAGDELVRMHQQDRKQGALLGRAQGDLGSAAADLERPEDTEFHRSPPSPQATTGRDPAKLASAALPASTRRAFQRDFSARADAPPSHELIERSTRCRQ